MERNWCCLLEEKAPAGTERLLNAYEVPVSQVTSFKYLGRVLMTEDNYWLSVVCNLRRAR